MRNKEEFKAELFRRRARYERQRKKRRNILFAGGIPAAICVILCCVIFQPERKSNRNIESADVLC